MDLHFHLGDLTSLGLIGLTERHALAVERAMRPWQPGAPGQAHVEMVAEPPPSGTERLGDAGDGWHTSRAGAWLVVRRRTGWFAVDPEAAAPRYRVARALAPGSLVRDVVSPALAAEALARGGAAVHGCYVRLPGAVPLISGWSESGKTEVALALAALGGVLTGDKWVLVGRDGDMAALPGPVHVRRWLPRYLPGVRSAIARGHRVRTVAAGAATRILDVAASRTGGSVALAADRLAGLADVGTRAQVPVDRLNGVWGRNLAAATDRATHLVLLRTVDGAVRCTRVPAASVIDRILLSSAVERRGQRELGDRARYLGFAPAGSFDGSATERSARALLTDAWGDLPAVEIAAPFPADPRPIAEAILDAVSS
jgi:hypothetical protein